MAALCYGSSCAQVATGEAGPGQIPRNKLDRRFAGAGRQLTSLKYVSARKHRGITGHEVDRSISRQGLINNGNKNIPLLLRHSPYLLNLLA